MEKVKTSAAERKSVLESKQQIAMANFLKRKTAKMQEEKKDPIVVDCPSA